MKLLITGSSGLIGSYLVPYLESQGNEVHCLVRDQKKVDSTHLFWDPETNVLDTDSIENYKVIIHLAGENISSRRWSVKQKDTILQSRVRSTRLLVEKINQTKNPPALFISASAIGIYGNRRDEILNEWSQAGTGFLAEVAHQWESGVSFLKSRHIRNVFLRTGVVLSTRRGALAKVLLPFKLGLGAVIGDGKQYMSWISIDDVVRAIQYIIQSDDLDGPVNIVSPNPVTNYQYSKALGKALKRPVLLKVPAWLLKFVLGEMADDLLLSSSRVIPQKLTDHGYSFLHPTIEQAFKTIFSEKS